jgi:hypothetical protein
MNEQLLERVPAWDWNGEIAVFDDHVEVRGKDERSWRYEEIRSVRLGRNPITSLTIRIKSGETVSLQMWRKDGLRAKSLIEAHRRKLKELRKAGFESLEDFEARAAELSRRLGM